MEGPTQTTVSRLLGELERGSRNALDELFRLVYGELRTLARYRRRRAAGDETLGTTAIVHEAYLKLVGQRRIAATSRAHFLAVAAKAMRHILSNHARAGRRRKRGGDYSRVSADVLEQVAARPLLSDDDAEMMAALESALSKLELTDHRLAQVVECRFYGGVSVADTAVALGTSPATVKRDWVLARALLYRELQQFQDPCAPTNDG